MKQNDEWSYAARLFDGIQLRAQQDVTGLNKEAMERIPSLVDGPSPEATAVILKAFGLEPSEFEFKLEERVEWDPSKFDIHNGRVPNGPWSSDPLIKGLEALGLVNMKALYAINFPVSPGPKGILSMTDEPGQESIVEPQKRVVSMDELRAVIPNPLHVDMLPTVFLESISDDAMITLIEAWQSAREAAGLGNCRNLHFRAEDNGDPLNIRNIRFPEMEEGELSSTVEFLSIPKREIPATAAKYVNLVETGVTKEWCTCLWEVHRDHVKIPEDHCVHCGEHRDHGNHNGGPVLTQSDVDEGFHTFGGRAVRLKEMSLTCPVHTKEGLILGYFEWMFRDAENVPSSDDAPGESVATGHSEDPGDGVSDTVPGTE